MSKHVNKLMVCWVVAGFAGAPPALVADAETSKAPPKIGQPAKDFTFKTIDGEAVQLSRLTKEGPVVLVVLRGYPGYQCGICTKQVADLRRDAAAYAQAGARVVLVYPGPGAGLGERADEFLGAGALPKPMTLVLDPNYKFTNAYGLRWNAPRETAYPADNVTVTGGVATLTQNDILIGVEAARSRIIDLSVAFSFNASESTSYDAFYRYDGTSVIKGAKTYHNYLYCKDPSIRKTMRRVEAAYNGRISTIHAVDDGTATIDEEFFASGPE
jgi:peroxiredoxin